MSVGLCCQGVNSTYQIRYGRSTSITGAYTDKSGVDMRNGGGTLRDSGNSCWIGPGGQDIHDTIVLAPCVRCHGQRASKLLINTLRWDSDGWPTY